MICIILYFYVEFHKKIDYLEHRDIFTIDKPHISITKQQQSRAACRSDRCPNTARSGVALMTLPIYRK